MQVEDCDHQIASLCIREMFGDLVSGMAPDGFCCCFFIVLLLVSYAAGTLRIEDFHEFRICRQVPCAWPTCSPSVQKVLDAPARGILQPLELNMQDFVNLSQVNF